MERLNVAGVTLEGFAQGGIRTSIIVPEVKSIFDIGTIVPGALRHKNIFVTHGHPDHIGALNSLIGRRDINELPVAQVHVPAAIAQPLIGIFQLWRKVQRAKIPIEIKASMPGDRFRITKDLEAIGVRTYHNVPSIGWVVERTTRKLKPEYTDLPGKQIGALRKEGVKVTDEIKTPILAIPGDTTIDFLVKQPLAQKAKVLVHEVTIWDDRSSVEKCRRYGHTHIDDMVNYCEKFEGDALVLCHRSMKYKRAEIEAIAKKKFPSSMLDKIHFFDGGDRHQ